VPELEKNSVISVASSLDRLATKIVFDDLTPGAVSKTLNRGIFHFTGSWWGFSLIFLVAWSLLALGCFFFGRFRAVFGCIKLYHYRSPRKSLPIFLHYRLGFLNVGKVGPASTGALKI
jgi:hypothetical protein